MTKTSDFFIQASSAMMTVASRQCCLCSLSFAPLPGSSGLMVRASDYIVFKRLGFESQLDPRFFSVDLFLTLSTKTSVQICLVSSSKNFDTYIQEDCVSWNSDQHDAHSWSCRWMVWPTFPEWDFSFYLLRWHWSVWTNPFTSKYTKRLPGKWKDCILCLIFHKFVIFLKNCSQS